VTPKDEQHWEDVGCNAQQLAKSARLAEAEGAARSIPAAAELTGYFHEKVSAFIEVGRALLVAGRQQDAATILAEAEQMARTLRNGGMWQEAYALADIADIWRSAGHTDETLRLWRAAVAATQVGVTDTWQLLARIARNLWSMGLEAEAHEVARLLPAGYPWGELPE
jgi:hypothetical protein